MKILVINGPNLNMISFRNKIIYGYETIEEINAKLNLVYTNVEFEFFQSNHEGYIIDVIHKAIMADYDGIVINPGALSHYSYAIMDALDMFKKDIVEVHLSDILHREEFRKVSITAKAATKVISGKGADGYAQAVEYILKDKEVL